IAVAVAAVDEKVACGFHGCLAHAFDYNDLLPFQLDQNRYFAAEREVGKLNYRGRQNRRHARIDGVAAPLEHSQSSLDRERRAARDSASFTANYGPKSVRVGGGRPRKTGENKRRDEAKYDRGSFYEHRRATSFELLTR